MIQSNESDPALGPSLVLSQADDIGDRAMLKLLKYENGYLRAVLEGKSRTEVDRQLLEQVAKLQSEVKASNEARGRLVEQIERLKLERCQIQSNNRKLFEQISALKSGLARDECG